MEEARKKERERKLRNLLRRQFEEMLERLSRLRAVSDETVSILLKALRETLRKER